MLSISGPGPPMVPGPSTSAAGIGGGGTTTTYSVTNHLGPSSSSAAAAPTAPPTSSDALLLTLRQRPNCRVFRALFQYLPLRDSPNDNPQLELSLQPGDVILIKGEMDSDGFYRGETLDGRSGLVPSNYVERVPDSVLLANAPRAPSPSFPLRIPSHLTTIAHDFSSPDHSTLPDSVCPYPPADVTKVTVQEIKNSETPRVPCPRELVVEKKLSRSALVSWSPPEESFVAVSQYHVCVDGEVRAIVPGSYKCRALVEDIALDKSVNLSVRAITEHGHSPDACCTVSLGNDSAVAPQQVRVWAVTPVSACVRWYPSNSNAEHVVSLNAVKVGVCPPTVFQVQLQGLQPSTIYRVSVRTKHPKAVLEQRPVERCIDFKTLPKIGLPDPPTNVQVEAGPQPGTLLVSWQPVANQPKPPSRAAVHSYLIYADGRNIAQVPSASADHVVLRLADLSDDPPIFITCRTKTKEGAVSSDSNVARVPRASAPIVDMTSSYPSYQHQAHPFQAEALYQQQANGKIGSAPATTTPYTAPARLVGATGLMTYQQPSYPIVNSAYATFDRSQNLATTNVVQQQQQQQQQALANPATANILTTRPSPHQSSLPNMWKSSTMNQYYTFHPSFLHTEPSGADDIRPSVLEMENSYLMRHRHPDWASAPESRDARARIEAYSRGLARAGSADERHRHYQQPVVAPAAHHRRLVAPRLARVKSETGFGTRSEPDLRPPTLLDSDENCRWFVALFDYSHHMSPNPNAEYEELPFRKHQLIKVYGEADADGFYQGAIGNRFGLVPSNMVIEIAKDDVIPRRTPAASNAAPSAAAPPVEPAIRRMRWGSLKSRSYDHAGDRSHYRSSLDRRADEREHRYRRGTAPREYRRATLAAEEDRYGPRHPRDDYYDDPEYRRRERERDYPRYDDRRRDREYDYREKYRERDTYDYPPPSTSRYDPPPPQQQQQQQQPPQIQQQQQPAANSMQPTQIPQQSQMQQLTHQMKQMQMPSQHPIMQQDQQPMYNGMATRKMVAKFDYDSRQLSPNVDAEQVELSFRQGDVITVFGEMDEDGFYMGELNGVRGLVPSNFLQTSPLTNLAPSQPCEPAARKGVAFSDTAAVRKTAAQPVRQSSQSSVSAAMGGQMAKTAGSAVPAKKSTAGQGQKPVTKKTSDVGKSGAPNARKTSNAVKKSDSTTKKGK